MTYLLDTNVISEGFKPLPDATVMGWLHHTDEDRLYLSVVVLAELQRGIELMPPGRRRAAFSVWVAEDVVARFSGRLLGVDSTVATAWGTLMARARRLGIGLSIMDGFLAATAQVHAFTLVSRNVRDFLPLGLSLLNPWDV